VTKDDLLRLIAESGYNVGFGAKKHFATYDIVSKAPNTIGFVSASAGILGLFIDAFSSKHMSAVFIIMGFAAIYIAPYDAAKDEYSRIGTANTELFNKLKALYFEVKGSQGQDLDAKLRELQAIEGQFYGNNLARQIAFSDWYAHYKFFWQHQIEWINEQKQFKFWRDKMPLSLTITLALTAVAIVALFVWALIWTLSCGSASFPLWPKG
jgi:hypothetical protein